MSAAHTPGPWEACDPGDYGDFDGHSRVILGNDRRIAVVHRHPSINTAQSDADASLIAAAPDMLAALEQSVLYVETLHSLMISDGRRTPATRALMANINASRAAIAKALGRTPNEIGDEG